MLTVYKYEIPAEDEFTIDLPAGAQPLSFQEQHGAGCMWALVDPEARTTKRRFRLAGTGHPIEYAEPAGVPYRSPPNIGALRFVGTAQFRGGALVFHLFEVLA